MSEAEKLLHERSESNGMMVMGQKECVQVKTIGEVLAYLDAKLKEDYTHADIRTNSPRTRTCFQVTVTKGQF